jgi:tetratricopeptide (TPR) repeat protein
LLQAASVVGKDVPFALLHAIADAPGEVSAQLGYLYVVAGRVAEGLAVLEEALAAMEAMGMFQWRTPLLWHLGEAYLLVSRRENALAQAERCLTLARERGHRGSEAYALRLLGEIASHAEHPDIATVEAHCGAALALASELGMRPLVAHCHLALGTLHRRTGDGAQAKQHLTTAMTLYREMDMGFWLARAEAEALPVDSDTKRLRRV